MHRRYVIEANHQDLSRLAGLPHGGGGTQRHVVVAGKNALQVGMLPDHRGRDSIRFILFPVRALDGNHFHAGIPHGILEPESALLGIERGRNTFENGDLVPTLQTRRQAGTHRLRPRAIVRTDERDLDGGLLKRGRIELVVDVDDHESLMDCLAEHRDQRFGVCRRDHDGVDALRHHLLDQGDLLREIAFVADAVDEQGVAPGVRRLMRLRALRPW